MTAVLTILAFCILILSHEFGHFIVAKMCGIYVIDFSLGMGPKLFSFKGKETEYVVRLLPIGGAVRMLGEDEDANDPRSFNNKSIPKRMAAIAAGPAMNFLVAILIFIIVYMGLGIYSGSNYVNPIEGQAAQAAGLQEGDRVISINEQAVEDWNGLSAVIQGEEPGTPLRVVYERNGESLQTVINPYFQEEDGGGRWLIGVQPTTETYPLFASIKLGFTRTYEMTKLLLVTLWEMIIGKTPVELGGPVMIVSSIGEAASMGAQTFLIFVALLCINLGVINLLPIPALDGSRLVFLAINGLRGKPLNPRTEGTIHLIGFALLMVLMIFITYKDILRLISG